MKSAVTHDVKLSSFYSQGDPVFPRHLDFNSMSETSTRPSLELQKPIEDMRSTSTRDEQRDLSRARNKKLYEKLDAADGDAVAIARIISKQGSERKFRFNITTRAQTGDAEAIVIVSTRPSGHFGILEREERRYRGSSALVGMTEERLHRV